MGEDLALRGRDAFRTPMQWDARDGAGFSRADADKLVRPLVDDGEFGYRTVNAAAQDAVRSVVGAVEASWFGDRHPEPGELAGPVRVVRDGIAAGSPVSLRGRLLPRSVLVRPVRSA